MPRIIAYSYCAALHCPQCTQKALNRGAIFLPYVTFDVSRDEWDIPDNPAPQDREGNIIYPVFSTDELQPDECCDDCLTAIR